MSLPGGFMIEEILAAGVASAAFLGDDPSARLLPAEAEIVRRAVASRVQEFTTARDCARRALSKLGIEPGAILSGLNREPLWPPGVTGSITHCEGYRAAAVAFQEQILTIGIDAEIDAPLPPGVIDLITVEAELAWLSRASAGVPWDRLLFSAKESVYKALFPFTRRPLGFEEVEVSFAFRESVFRAVVLTGSSASSAAPSADLPILYGRYLRRNGFILTAVTVPAGGGVIPTPADLFPGP